MVDLKTIEIEDSIASGKNNASSISSADEKSETVDR